MSDFCVIDVETANADYSSICQIGIAEFNNGILCDQREWLINPNDYFDYINVSIHGIDERTVENSPTFEEIHGELNEYLYNKVVGHHMPFDRIAIKRACERNSLCQIEAVWIDSAKIVRRAWEEFSYRGYGLSNVAMKLGIDFQHHNALEDAIAAGKIILKAIEHSQMSLDEWLERVNKPISLNSEGLTSIKLQGNSDGSLYGENIVFTGSLSMPRSEAAKIAADLGCNVSNSVNKKTTMLVVGMQDATRLAGYAKSTKHRKAEELIKSGCPIRIMSEKDFVNMIEK